MDWNEFNKSHATDSGNGATVNELLLHWTAIVQGTFEIAPFISLPDRRDDIPIGYEFRENPQGNAGWFHDWVAKGLGATFRIDTARI